VSQNERPGVYTSYQVTSTLTGKGSGGAVGLAACAAAGTVGQLTEITAYAQAIAAYGEGSAMAKLIRVLLLGGAAKVIATPVLVGSGTATTANYTAAFAVLMQNSAVRYMVCDSRDAAVLGAMKTAITGADSEKTKYRIGLGEMSGTASALTAAAAVLNCERMVLVSPGEKSGTPGAVAAAVAAVISGSDDPALPLNGAELAGLGELSGSFSDSDITTLVQGGVTPVETVGGAVSVVRAVTSRTTTNSVADATWRELSTILIVDTVIPTVRDALRAKFARVKNTAQTRGAIRTAVVVELEQLLSREIIESYGDVSAAADEADPTVCDVSFAFTVAHGLCRISLVANIKV
jgi:phage tail sheath gpL-like